jgi:hypothetical protein
MIHLTPMAQPLLDVAITQVQRCAKQPLNPAVLFQIMALFRAVIAGAPPNDLSALLQVTIGTTAPLDRIIEVLLVLAHPSVEPPEPPNSEISSTTPRKPRPWSRAEDTRLLAGIHRFGLEGWSSIAEFVGGNRTRAQCAQRWARGLNPRLLKTDWTYQDEEQLLALIREYGTKKWTRIAGVVGNRSDVQCRYHFLQMIRDGRIEADPAKNGEGEVWKRTVLTPLEATLMAHRNEAKRALRKQMGKQLSSEKLETIENGDDQRTWMAETQIPTDDELVTWIGTGSSSDNDDFIEDFPLDETESS